MLDVVGACDGPAAGGGQRIAERRKTQTRESKNKLKNKEKATEARSSGKSLDPRGRKTVVERGGEGRGERMGAPGLGTSSKLVEPSAKGL